VALFVVDRTADGVAVEPVTTTNRQPAGHLALTGAVAEQLGNGSPAAITFITERLLLGGSAVALGVAAEALRRAAEYTSQRHQFGRPLSSFQSTAHRAADSYIDVGAMRATLWQAAWLVDQYDDPEHDSVEASAAVLTAAWWAADGGERVVQAVQHLHGGLGADIDYPVHRYFLWGKQLALTLGGASANLAHLGELIARRALATQEVNG
jgi:alkylation response protein AidB-like acyl-CoA dehydrogenase